MNYPDYKMLTTLSAFISKNIKLWLGPVVKMSFTKTGGRNPWPLNKFVYFVIVFFFFFFFFFFLSSSLNSTQV